MKKISLFRRFYLAVVAAVMLSPLAASAAPLPTTMRYDFGVDAGVSAAPAGYVKVAPQTLYNANSGYGFEPGAAIAAVDRGGAEALRNDFVTSAAPFSFSQKLPPGAYRVTITFGDAQQPTVTSVKAELRRLMLQSVRTDAGQFVTREFIVHVRQPEFGGNDRVKLKQRERDQEMIEWDDKLTLEFCDDHPAVDALTIEPADVPTIYLLGDSTVCDQPREPWNSWGQMLPRWLKPDVVVANYANSGESLRSSMGSKRLDAVLAHIHKGDWLLIQFGHNDMKRTGEGVGAFTTYKADLKHYADAATARGGTVILVTSMERKENYAQGTLGDYPAAVRQLAQEDHLPLIDLNAMSKLLYKAMGDDINAAFVDGTHHTNFGSYEISKCIVQGLRDVKVDLADHIVDDFAGFDPAHPDHPAAIHLAPGAAASTTQPLGS